MTNGATSVQTESVEMTEEERNRAIGEMLAYRERQLTQRYLESLEGIGLESVPMMSAEEARKYVSNQAYEMIVQYETGGRKYYESYYKSAPVWPGYSSGVTIGFGYDLGYVQEDEFVEVWGKILPANDVERLKEAIGLTGSEAQSLARRMKDIKVTWEVSETVFCRNTLPKFVGLAKNALENFDPEGQLHPHCTGALVSLVFNRGADFKSSSDKRLEMRNIRSDMAKPRFADIPGEFRKMKRHWTSQGLRERRDDEADLFEKGLELARDRKIAQQSAPAPQPTPAPTPAAPAADPAAGAPDGFSNLPMPSLPTQAPAIDTGAPAQTAQAGIPAPTEMGALESIYGAASKTPKVSLEDDYLAYDQQPIEKIEKQTSLESTGGSFKIADVCWASEDNEIPDYRGIAGITQREGTFEFTAADFETIIKANRYRPVSEGHGKVLFGLRGCQLAGETDKQMDRDALKLKIARPDHRNFRCTIGVFDTKTRKLSGFIASTVPNRSYVYTCWQRAQDDEDLAGNMLPTGCYGYIVGQHNSTPSAFVLRITQEKKRTVAVWRSTDDVTFTVQDDIDVCEPGDNIHPAYSASTAEFSSAGCQTIRGNSSGGHNGEWALFRIAAGLPKDGNGRYGTPYSYVLMTGLEAKAAAEMRANGEIADEAKFRAKLVRLRQGSQSDEVKALQGALNLSQTGVFAAAEAEALAKWQREKLGFNDAIYSMEFDGVIGAPVLGVSQVAAAPAPAAQPSPVGRPDAVPRPDLGGGGQTAAGWALESVGGGRGPARPAALANTTARSHVQALLTEDDYQLVRRLGQITEQVKADPRRAGQLELVVQRAAPGQEGIFDALAEIGERVYGRIEPELYRIVCGSSSVDARDRNEIQKALASLAKSTGASKTEVVTTVAGVLISSGIAFYGVALVVAAIFARRFAQATLEETCRVWGSRRRMAAGPSGRGSDSETA